MTIQNYSSASFGNKSNSLLSSLLSKPISKPSSAHKKKPSFHLNQHLLQSSIALININRQKFPNTIIPIKSSHHRINWQWSPTPSSAMLSDDQKSVCFHSECESCFETDAVSGNKPLKPNAFTYWEITVLNNEQLNGSSIQIGIGNKNARMNTVGYLNLLGMDENSYGLSHTGQAWHKNESRQVCDKWDKGTCQSGPITIGCLFNGFNGQLSYFKNGVCLGVAFEGIDMKESLYPMMSSTVAKSCLRLDFVCESFPSLKEMCRKIILSDQRVQFDNENLPKSLIKFLKV